MSWTGQSDATQSVASPSASHTSWARVTTGCPSGTTFGPTTRSA